MRAPLRSRSESSSPTRFSTSAFPAPHGRQLRGRRPALPPVQPPGHDNRRSPAINSKRGSSRLLAGNGRTISGSIIPCVRIALSALPAFHGRNDVAGRKRARGRFDLARPAARTAAPPTRSAIARPRRSMHRVRAPGFSESSLTSLLVAANSARNSPETTRRRIVFSSGFAAAALPPLSRATSSTWPGSIGIRTGDFGSTRSPESPWLGLSESRTLRGIDVWKTLSGNAFRPLARFHAQAVACIEHRQHAAVDLEPGLATIGFA